MSQPAKSLTRRALEVAIAFTPWVLSAFALYWLQLNEIWTTATPHRGKISVAILVTGMGLSFVLRSYFVKSARKTNTPD